MSRRKVCEINKVYFRPDGHPDRGAPKSDDLGDSLADRFENLIDLQDQAGYELEDWQITSASTDEVLTEAIVAVFKERPK